MMPKSNTSWSPDQFGNPNGRPKGRSPAARLREQIEPHQTKIIEQLIAKGMGGDLQAASLVLRYLYPVPKSTHELIDLDDFGETPAEKARAVWDGVVRGEIAPDIGEKLMAMLSDVCRIEEIVELAEQLATLRTELDELKH